MSQKPDKLQVNLKYKQIEQQISAEPQEAWLLVNKFFIDLIPAFEIAQKLWLNVDLKQIAQDLTGIAVFSADGVNLIVPKNKLTDNEALMIWLSAVYIGNKLGMINSDSMSKEELQTKLGKSSKITSTRLGELAKTNIVQKTAENKFRITTFGVVQTQKEVLPRIRTKIGT